MLSIVLLNVLMLGVRMPNFVMLSVYSIIGVTPSSPTKFGRKFILSHFENPFKDSFYPKKLNLFNFKATKIKRISRIFFSFFAKKVLSLIFFKPKRQRIYQSPKL
jgi:hypothetical protein